VPVLGRAWGGRLRVRPLRACSGAEVFWYARGPMERTHGAPAVVTELLSGVSDLEMRELCIKALREAYRGGKPDLIVRIDGDLCMYLPELLGERKGWNDTTLPATGLVEVYRRDPSGVRHWLFKAAITPEGTSVVEFVMWLVRAGLAWPLDAPSSDIVPQRLRLSRAGDAFLRSSGDHPFLPGYVARLKSRCPGVPDDVLALWTDARECLEHGLTRPAIVLLGVAYETAVEHIVQALVTAQKLPAKTIDDGAAKRLSAVKAEIDKLLPAGTVQEKDDRFATHAACAFADQLRRRRNDASHTTPAYGFEDRGEVEELILSAGRHLPDLWRIRTTVP
jgi:hypothetical protein